MSEKKYGAYQKFQSECMKKVDENNPNSLSKIEIITGQYGAHSNERMVQCSTFWKDLRGSENPIGELEKQLNFAQQLEKGEVKEPSE